MRTKEHLSHSTKIAKLVSCEIIINNSDNGFDLLRNIYCQGFDKVIIHENNIVPAFFDMQNGLAGEVLQKFSTYRVRLVIIADFKKFTRKSIREFIYESDQNDLACAWFITQYMGP